MAFTFYKAQGKEIGGSLVEDDRVEMAKALLAKAGDKLVLPVDTVVTDAFDFDARKVGTLKTVAWDEIGPTDIGVDIGEATRAKFAGIVKRAKTVVWNGPMGVFEIDDAAKGTLAVARRWPTRRRTAPSRSSAAATPSRPSRRAGSPRR